MAQVCIMLPPQRDLGLPSQFGVLKKQDWAVKYHTANKENPQGVQLSKVCLMIVQFYHTHTKLCWVSATITCLTLCF